MKELSKGGYILLGLLSKEDLSGYTIKKILSRISVFYWSESNAQIYPVLKKLEALIRELIKKEMEEASVTGNLDGGAGPPKTPYAFYKKPKSKKDKEKEKAITTAGGYMKVKEAKFHVRTEMGSVLVDASGKSEAIMKVARAMKKGRKAITSANRVGMSQAKQVDQKIENVTEARYHDWKRDESLTPRQKIGKSIREVRHSLSELDRVVKMAVKLKTELNMDSRSYWKNTHKALTKISERLVKMANKVGNLK